jgi:hypothetical protein
LLVFCADSQTNAKVQKIEQKLAAFQEQKAALKAQRKAEDAIQQDAAAPVQHRKPARCSKWCHGVLATDYRVVGENNKDKHDCKALGIPKCTSFAKCGYVQGHLKEIRVDKQIAKLEQQKAQADKDAADKVWLTLAIADRSISAANYPTQTRCLCISRRCQFQRST